jgi:hypothetical protein
MDAKGVAFHITNRRESPAAHSSRLKQTGADFFVDHQWNRSHELVQFRIVGR